LVGLDLCLVRRRAVKFADKFGENNI
jgi:hypothetical protein